MDEFICTDGVLQRPRLSSPFSLAVGGVRTKGGNMLAAAGEPFLRAPAGVFLGAAGVGEGAEPSLRRSIVFKKVST